MMNVYNILLGKLDKRDLFSRFIKMFKFLDVIVVYKEGIDLNKKQKKLLLKNNIEIFNIDNIDTIEKRYIIISYGIDNYSDVKKFKDLSDNLIILSARGSVRSHNLISQRLNTDSENIFSLYSESSKRFIYKVNGEYKSLTKDQLTTIISREIRLKKIKNKL